jgi:hypothetical protein
MHSYKSLAALLIGLGLLVSAFTPLMVKLIYLDDIELEERRRRRRLSVKYSLILLWSVIALLLLAFWFVG